MTDEEAKENWKKYGNPDGPGGLFIFYKFFIFTFISISVTHFGIALPKWLVDHKNSVFVLLIYAGVFMIVLPVIIVCIDEYKVLTTERDIPWCLKLFIQLTKRPHVLYPRQGYNCRRFQLHLP